MRYCIQILLIGMLTGLLACDSLITTVPESKLPRGAQKLVMHSYITPQDTVILVKLTTSSPLLGVYTNNGFGYTIVGKDTIFYTGGPVDNARVVLSDSKQNSVVIPYNKTDAVYMIDARRFPIKAGETYTLTAEATLGKIEANCTVPVEVAPITEYQIDTTSVGQGEGVVKTFNINFKWQDITDQPNYYSTKINVLATMLVPEARGNQYVYNPRLIRYNGYWTEDVAHELYQSDLNRDGKTIESPKGIVSLYSEIVRANGQTYPVKFGGQKSIVTLEVLNTDKNYYNYHRSVRNNNRQDDNPFAEPVPIFSNVKNGLGCFAASNKSVLKVVY
ncbi:DUF4249 domain-containing protein [Emticicia sp. 17c]|uniref:DUF4249 domain-containing protein n=1 Tax=Emticicia sp. 17c TaxID=3127704 RepID=UPI00301D4922